MHCWQRDILRVFFGESGGPRAIKNSWSEKWRGLGNDTNLSWQPSIDFAEQTEDRFGHSGVQGTRTHFGDSVGGSEKAGVGGLIPSLATIKNAEASIGSVPYSHFAN